MGYKIEEEDETMRAKCLECGDAMEYGGRSDRKFCSRECKNRYHNRINRTSRAAVKNADSSLSRNYEILVALVRQGITQLPLADVVAMGFNLSYLTSYAVCGGHTVHFCYDISYRLTRTRMCDILKVQPVKHKKR